MSALFLPALCAAVLTAGLFARIDVYGAFVRGAKAGMETLLQMAPCLCAVLTLTALLRETGLLGALTEALRPALEALRAGRLPLRVTHNDTKLNNILIDKDTGEGICVIDLDTVMPGLSINDFGDSIRFGANHSAEDERDLSKVNFDLPLFDIYTKGFLEGAAGTLTDAEKEYLPWGAKLMTLECGIRFLTDYLEGDTYFKIHRDGQNLDRCRTQFKLVRDMEARWDEMAAVVKKYS